MAAEAENTTQVSRNGVEWEQARNGALRRDQYRCQHCDFHAGMSHADIQVHHIKPVDKGGTHDLENLATLCNSCHQYLHAHHDEKERLDVGLLEQKGSATLGWPDERKELTSCETQVVELLREQGPTKRAELSERLDYAYTTIGSALNRLQTSRHIVRVSRGVYAYITKSEYRELMQRESDKHGRTPVKIWDPGKQVEISEFVDGPREGDNA